MTTDEYIAPFPADVRETLDREIPPDLIRRITAFRAEENLKKGKKGER